MSVAGADAEPLQMMRMVRERYLRTARIPKSRICIEASNVPGNSQPMFIRIHFSSTPSRLRLRAFTRFYWVWNFLKLY